MNSTINFIVLIYYNFMYFIILLFEFFFIFKIMNFRVTWAQFLEHLRSLVKLQLKSSVYS